MLFLFTVDLVKKLFKVRQITTHSCDLVGDGQVDFEEFVTLLGPKLSAAGMPDKFHGTDFDSVFWKVILITDHYFRSRNKFMQSVN